MEHAAWAAGRVPGVKDLNCALPSAFFDGLGVVCRTQRQRLEPPDLDLLVQDRGEVRPGWLGRTLLGFADPQRIAWIVEPSMPRRTLVTIP